MFAAAVPGFAPTTDPNQNTGLASLPNNQPPSNYVTNNVNPFAATAAAPVAAAPTGLASLTPDVAKNLMWRSMTTGAPTSEFDQYGGYNAVRDAYTAAGGGYSREEIPFSVKQQAAEEMLKTGVGNLGLLYDMGMALPQSAIDNLRSQGVAESTLAGLQAADPVKRQQYELEKQQYERSQFVDQAPAYVEQVLADTSLSDWEKTRMILDKQQQVGMTQAEMAALFGTDTAVPYLQTYKSGITDYINQALAKDPNQTTFDEIGQIHQAASKYGLNYKDIAQYTGMDEAQAKSYFDMYDQGLGNIVSKVVQSGLSSPDATRSLLSLQNSYGTTDAELAKASGYSESTIKNALEPVRDVSTKMHELMTSDKYTADDVRKFIEDTRQNSRAQEVYGTTLAQLEQNMPALLLRDAANGNDVAKSYQEFLTLAKATPESTAKYAPQIKAVEQAKSIIDRHALNKDFGGEYKDYAMEMFLGLDNKTKKQAPTQLALTAPKTEKATGIDEYGQSYTYDQITPAELKSSQKGVEAIRDEEGNVTGYTKLLDAEAFDEAWPGQKERFGVRANYDAAGNLTGYTSGARVHISDPQYYQAAWDANGKPKPVTGANSGGGFFKGVANDALGAFADAGLAGQLALMYLTGGLGSMAGSALTSSLGPALAQAVGAGVVGGTMAELGGGEFGKGFAGGAVGSGVGNLTQGLMPSSGFTGAPIVDAYLAQALPQAAGNMARTGVMGGDMGDAGLYSLLNTGVNMGTNSLLKSTPIGTLPKAAQPYATGVASNVISSALTGKNPNLENALMKTVIQQAMSTGKQAAKTAATK